MIFGLPLNWHYDLVPDVRTRFLGHSIKLQVCRMVKIPDTRVGERKW
jgi:hypothetical protein